MKTCEHPESPAVARCIACGKRLCYECRIHDKGRNFCHGCVPIKRVKVKSPTFSMILSLLPGLGQIYAGSIMKGLLFLGGTGAFAAMHEGIPAVLPMIFWVISIWDARMTAHKRNFQATNGRSGVPGASEADWMLLGGTAGLALLYVALPFTAGLVMEPWMLWVSFLVILSLSALLGRGGKNVKTA
jgi:hypothetical protein